MEVSIDMGGGTVRQMDVTRYGSVTTLYMLTSLSNQQALVSKSGPRQPMALFENALKAAQELRVRYGIAMMRICWDQLLVITCMAGAMDDFRAMAISIGSVSLYIFSKLVVHCGLQVYQAQSSLMFIRMDTSFKFSSHHYDDSAQRGGGANHRAAHGPCAPMGDARQCCFGHGEAAVGRPFGPAERS